MNAYGSEKRICLALGVLNLDAIGSRIQDLLKDLTAPRVGFIEKLKTLPKLNKVASWIPKSISGAGSCQEIILKSPDLFKFPILKCWPYDGGRFITLPMVITKDPGTGLRNVGMYRMQVFSKDTTGMHWHRHKTGARHYAAYKQKGIRMPIAVALGGDPVYAYSATAPLPDNMDEFLFAGFLRNRKVELVKCMTQDIQVPSDCDIIIEGYVDPQEDLKSEGPFGDHTGFYSLADYYPVFHVTCITHKKNAVYPSTIVGIPPQEDKWIAKATERIFIEPIRKSILPEITDMDLPVEGTAHNLAIISMDKTYPGQGIKVMNALWGAGQMMFNKIIIIVDKNTDVHNYYQVLKAIVENTDVFYDIHFNAGPLDVLDHSSPTFAFGSKLGIDATIKSKEETFSIKQSEENQILSLLNFNTKTIPELISINKQFINDHIPLIIIAIKKDKYQDLRSLSNSICNQSGFDHMKYIVAVDDYVDINDLSIVIWYSLANIDPKRDIYQVRVQTNKKQILFIDGTNKAAESLRNWPNVILSDDQTIQGINAIWKNLGMVDFIESPSNKYKMFVKTEGAGSDRHKE